MFSPSSILPLLLQPVFEDFSKCPEAKEAELWAPHGSLFSEVLQQPYSYENFTFLDYKIP